MNRSFAVIGQAHTGKTSFALIKTLEIIVNGKLTDRVTKNLHILSFDNDAKYLLEFIMKTLRLDRQEQVAPFFEKFGYALTITSASPTDSTTETIREVLGSKFKSELNVVLIDGCPTAEMYEYIHYAMCTQNHVVVYANNIIKDEPNGTRTVVNCLLANVDTVAVTGVYEGVCYLRHTRTIDPALKDSYQKLGDYEVIETNAENVGTAFDWIK